MKMIFLAFGCMEIPPNGVNKIKIQSSISSITSFVPERSNKKGARFAKARETVAFLLAQKSSAKNALPYSLWFVVSQRLLQHSNEYASIF